MLRRKHQRGRGHAKQPWNTEKELKCSLTRALKAVKSEGNVLSRRNLRKLHSIANATGRIGQRSLISVLADSADPEEAVNEVSGYLNSKGKMVKNSEIRSLNSGELGSVVTIPNTPTVIQTPFRMVVAGPSMCGKTTLVKAMLKNRKQVFDPCPSKIYWFYAMESSVTKAREEFPHITFIKNLPTDQWIEETVVDNEGTLFIIDDLMGNATNAGKKATQGREMMNELFTRGSHHKKVSVIFTVQSLFRGPNMREISLNASQTVAFNNNRDKTYLRSLGTQLFPAGNNGAAFISACMGDISKEHFGYLFIDHGSFVKPGYQFKSNVLKEQEQKYYVPYRDLRHIDLSQVTDSKPLDKGYTI